MNWIIYFDVIIGQILCEFYCFHRTSCWISSALQSWRHLYCFAALLLLDTLSIWVGMLEFQVWNRDVIWIALRPSYCWTHPQSESVCWSFGFTIVTSSVLLCGPRIVGHTLLIWVSVLKPWRDLFVVKPSESGEALLVISADNSCERVRVPAYDCRPLLVNFLRESEGCSWGKGGGGIILGNTSKYSETRPGNLHRS